MQWKPRYSFYDRPRRRPKDRPMRLLPADEGCGLQYHRHIPGVWRLRRRVERMRA